MSSKKNNKEKMMRRKEEKKEEPETPRYCDHAKECREDQNPDYEPTELGSFDAVVYYVLCNLCNSCIAMINVKSFLFCLVLILVLFVATSCFFNSELYVVLLELLFLYGLGVASESVKFGANQHVLGIDVGLLRQIKLSTWRAYASLCHL
ncbi:unnamed protein product [Miscanthus lutarioriparius]|uniref:RED-like N-terminal domain-containing protein n=1 Tax=Miscanthus lutarioriparius TaxID=422564 RepID=A0A811RG76_9POAL|nr:unnamed protein product [Miscanthus lutarioriparius]